MLVMSANHSQVRVLVMTGSSNPKQQQREPINLITTQRPQAN